MAVTDDVDAAMRLHLLGGPGAAFEDGAPAPELVVEGAPTFRTSVHYESPDGRLITGVWSATPGAWRVAYDEWEWCRLRSGRCVLTPDGGEPVDYEAGDAIVIEPGFVGVWTVVEACEKDFVVMLPPPPDDV
ncbi:cupin domain-containing protein [Methylopila sp. Yamaguchi]|uniref:cupin domain-containing protein n=1 Tax=Methylopila sp. Yamaguchi TaxID=1437817 RepID=UPI000CCC1318|nr:cupin domain-containing protein [Methylopila sp. Yamaguchi]